MSTALLLAGDCPGYFVHVANRLGERLRCAGIQPVFALPSPFYERFHELNLAATGPVWYASEFSCAPEALTDVSLDYWMVYPTFERATYFTGGHTNPWSEYQKLTLFYREIFRAHPDISVVWSENPSNAFLCLAYAEATRLGIPFCGYVQARIPGHFNVFLDFHCTRMLPVTNGSGPAPDVTAFESLPESEPDYMRNRFNRLQSVSTLEILRGTPLKFIRALRSVSGNSIETGNPLLWQLRAYKKILGRKIRQQRLSRRRGLFEVIEPPGEELSVLFPLQFRPEASTSVLARHFGDDLDVLRNIAFSLPFGSRLYVKEHPSAVGMRDLAFYRQVKSFPAVHLLGPDIRAKELLDRVDLVVTLSSTVGFEALQAGVPVLLLGRAFYEDYPGVVRVKSWDHLMQVVKTFTRRPSRDWSEEVTSRYLRSCHPGSFNYLHRSVLHAANLESLSKPLVQVATNPILLR